MGPLASKPDARTKNDFGPDYEHDYDYEHEHERAQSPRIRSAASGAMLVELIISLGIVTFGLFGVFEMYFVGLDRARSVREVTRAVTALDNELETLRAAPFDELRNNDSQPFRSDTAVVAELIEVSPTVTIRDHADPDSRLKEVTATVRWRDKCGRAITKQAVTLIGERGRAL